MKIQIYLIAILLGCVPSNYLNAQSKKIEITHKQIGEGYEFYCENWTKSPYLLKVTFSDLCNLRPSFNSKKEITVRPGKQRIFTLKKERENKSINFNYKYTYRKGSLPVKLNPDFTYLLPLKPNRVTRAMKVAY